MKGPEFHLCLYFLLFYYSCSFTPSSRSAALTQTEMSFGVENEVVDDDEELKRALALSRQDIDVEDEEADLRRAIQLSMQGKTMSHKVFQYSEMHLSRLFAVCIWITVLIKITMNHLNSSISLHFILRNLIPASSF